MNNQKKNVSILIKKIIRPANSFAILIKIKSVRESKSHIALHATVLSGIFWAFFPCINLVTREKTNNTKKKKSRVQEKKKREKS